MLISRHKIQLFVIVFVLATCLSVFRILKENQPLRSIIPPTPKSSGVHDDVVDDSPYLSTLTSTTPESSTVSTSGQINLTKSMHDKNLESIYTMRRQNLALSCKHQNRTQRSDFDPYKMQNSLKVAKTFSILYCGIAKVASTFWLRTLTVMEAKGDLNSPFQLRRSQSRLVDFSSLRESMNKIEMMSFLNKATSFLFVRDPYARLYSAYENKIYNPNMMFWKSTGRKVIQSVRTNATLKSLKYGHDVKFAELVKYILTLHNGSKTIDGHFRPMHDICDPCLMPYAFVGKLETFQEDVKYLLDSWRDKYSDIHVRFEDFEKETVMDTARGHIRFLFQLKKILKNKDFKYPFYKLILRTWSDFQIRGFLSKNISLPFKQSDSENITPEMLTKAIHDALDIPVDRAAVRMQRDEALIQAYRTVPLEDMEKLRMFVLADCNLFGYDDRPTRLFDRSPPLDDEHIYMAGLL